MPTLSSTAFPLQIAENRGDSMILTFELKQDSPAAGLEVSLKSGVRRSLAEFDVFSAVFQHG